MTNPLLGRNKRVPTESILGISAAMLVSLAVAVPTGAATRYVNVSNASATAPYTTWATAANVIQDAVDLAQPGDEIVVTNGVYETGGRAAQGALSNRVAVTKPLMLRSVNGPDVTAIRGYQVPGTTNGHEAVRCVYLANGATLVGFTLTGGATRTNEDNSLPSSATGGGVWCESRSAILSNCILSSNIAYFQGGGAYRGTLNNCRLLNNRASGILFPDPDFGPGAAAGGGACDAELNNCVLSNNTADHSGGAALSTLSHCTIVGNRSTVHGGGAGGAILDDRFSTLNHCLVVSNVAAWSGGGTFGAVMTSCVIARNTAGDFGGGAFGRTLDNCVVFANRAWVGGGVFKGDLNNCTLTGNSASIKGGGAIGNTAWGPPDPTRLNNCIVYSNSAPSEANWGNWTSPTGDGIVFNNSCTVPLPTHGIGNITNAPLFVDPSADDFRLRPNSPCINAGLNAYTPVGPDVDGNPRIAGGTVDMGPYEFQSPQSIISYAWLQQFGLSTGGSVDLTDPDNDGLNTLQEWRAGTDPTNSLSVLRLLTPVANGSGLRVRWRSVGNRRYFLERGSNPGGQPAFAPLATDIVGRPDVTTYNDTNSVGSAPFIYRVGVRE
jgi:hypothetical protein